MRPRPSSILALATASLGLVSCSLVVDALGPYDSAGGASAPFCASLSTAPQLCADFDEGKPYNAGWSSVFLSGGGTLALQPGVDVSPPDSLEAKTPPFAEPATAGLSYDFTAQARTVHLESQIRIDAIGPDQCFVALAITQQQAGSSGPYLQVQLFLCSGKAFAQEQDSACACNPNDYGLPNKFSLGSWHRYVMEVALGSTPSMTFWVDDLSTPVLAAVPLAYGWQASPFSVQSGIGYIGGGTGEAIQAEFDDVETYAH
jgi:hypothetical protein